MCITGCQPDCDGRQCGDDGCGGVCGTCGLEESCAWTGKCVPDTWFCDSSLYADGTACHCGCGAYDPNCDSTDIVFGCATSGSTCSAAGICSDATCAADTECGAGVGTLEALALATGEQPLGITGAFEDLAAMTMAPGPLQRQSMRAAVTALLPSPA